MKALGLIVCLVVFCESVAQKMPVVEQVSFPKDTLSIVSFGAIPDGSTLNTNAIAEALSKCAAGGGGVVIIPRGLWLTGPIALKSNVNLHLERGAILQFTDDLSQYPLMKTNWEGVDAIRNHSPIYGADLENIAITGQGILDGAGQAWRPIKKNKVTPPEWQQLVASGGFLNEKQDIWYPTESSLKGASVKRAGVVAEGYDLTNAVTVKDFLRPNMLSLIRCRKILLEGVTFQNSPAWCLHPLLSQHLTVRNVTVRNPWNAQNGDGIDLESCRYVLIEQSTFDVGDDGICIKSGRDEEGRKRGVPTEDVIVRNSTVFHGHGGFVIGSEMSGGARNIFVYDCNFLGTDIGLRFKTTRGRGGIVEKIFIENIRMNNIGGAAILFDMYYMAKDPLSVFSGEDNPSIEFQPVTEGTPQFRDITIKNVVCKGAETAIFVRGLPEMNIKNIILEDIFIESKSGFVCIEGEGIQLRNASLNTDDQTAIQVVDSKNITLDRVTTNAVETLLSISGKRSKGIRLLNSKAEKVNKEVEFGAGVSKDIFQKK